MLFKADSAARDLAASDNLSRGVGQDARSA